MVKILREKGSLERGLVFGVIFVNLNVAVERLSRVFEFL